jgi:hypothetical protein
MRTRLPARAATVVFTIALLLFAVPIAGAAPPSNDNFASAALIDSFT